jgi:hypothetical protein
MDNELINKKISRFKYCTERFYPYIAKVLERLPEEIRSKGVLDDLGFEIISFGDTGGQFISFSNPISNLVILEEKILNLSEYQILHCIVHEIAHKIADTKGFQMHEKEAEELVKEWGFETESDLVDYHRPILESAGYQQGYEWAKQQKDLSKFEEYYYEWNEDRLTSERFEMLVSDFDPLSTFMEGEEIKPKSLDTLTSEAEEGKVYVDDSMSLEKGVIVGIMSVIKERKEKHISSLVDDPKAQEEVKFIECLERSHETCQQLFDSSIWPEIKEKYSEIDNFLSSIGEIADLLEDLKNNQR